MQVTQQDIADAATDNGLFGAALCVHSSLSSFGHVSGGARAVVDGMQDAGCTVMAPAFCYTLAATPPPGRWLPRNAWDYGDGPPVVSSEVYTPDRNDIDDSMGAISAAVVETLGRSRGNNPLNSFAAVGPMAGKLTAGQAPLDVNAPLRRLARLGGYVVMMGIDLQSMTALHLAEQMAGASTLPPVGERPRRRGHRSGGRWMLTGFQQHRTATQADRAPSRRRQQPLAHLPHRGTAPAGLGGDPQSARDHPVRRHRMQAMRRRHSGRSDFGRCAVGTSLNVKD